MSLIANTAERTVKIKRIPGTLHLNPELPPNTVMNQYPVTGGPDHVEVLSLMYVHAIKKTA